MTEIIISKQLADRLKLPGFDCAYKGKPGIAWTGFHHQWTPRGRTSINRSELHLLSQMCADRIMVAIPKGNYERTGPRVIDHHVMEDEFRDIIELREPSTHPERLNFGLTGKKHVLVDDGGEELRQTKSWRTYLLIADGKLHLQRFLVRVPRETFESMRIAGIIVQEKPWNENSWYPIDVERLNLLSTNWARPNALRLVRVLQEAAGRRQQKAALKARKELLGFVEEDDDDIYSSDETTESITGQYQAPIVIYQLQGNPVFPLFDFSVLFAADTRVALKWVRRRIRTLQLIARQITIASEVARVNKMLRKHKKRFDPCPPYYWDATPQDIGDNTFMQLGKLNEGPVARVIGTRFFDR